MTSITFDDSALERKSSRADLGEKRLTRIGLKSKTLRPDSPTTIEACKELGILVEELKQKTIEDFRAPGADEDIISLRFNRYMKRYNQFIKDVQAKKKAILKAQQRNQRLQEQLQQQLNQSGRLNGAKSSGNLPAIPNLTMNTTFSPRGNNTLLGSPLMSTYNKTMMYLRSSHDTAEIKSMGDILGVSGSRNGLDTTFEQFDTALANEILKFNRIKKQKQKEAKDAFEEEVRRIKIMEEVKEKERRKQEREKRMALEKKKTDQEKKKAAEEKLEKIREADRRFRTQKMEEQEKINKKLEDAKKKFAEEMEERKRQIAENEQKLAQKRKIAEERRLKLKELELMRCDELKDEIFRKIYQSQELHNTTMYEKVSKAQQEVQKMEDKAQKVKQKQQEDLEQHVQTLVEKLVKKEESLQDFQKLQLQAMKKREKELKARSQKVSNHQSDLSQKYEERMEAINERFRKVQENLEAKRKQDEKELKIRQEATKLRILDKQENCQRRERQIQHERQKFLEKQKYNEEKLAWLKSQKEILKQAKSEVSIQAKIEKDRIENAVQVLSKVTYEHGTTANVNDQQKRILRSILQPQDYKSLEAEERRREEERREAEERRKAGNKV